MICSPGEDLRRWFLTHECELFRYRFDLEDGQSVNSFLKDNGLSYAPMDGMKKETMVQKLAAVRSSAVDQCTAINFPARMLSLQLTRVEHT